MAGSRNKKKAQENRTTIQFDDKDSRLNFVQERMDTLLDEFGQSYGAFLAEELQKRLDYTIKIFHEDASELLTRMVIEGNARIEMSDEIRQGKKIEDLVRKSVFNPVNKKQKSPVIKAAKAGDSTLDELDPGTDRVGIPKSMFKKR